MHGYPPGRLVSQMGEGIILVSADDIEAIGGNELAAGQEI